MGRAECGVVQTPCVDACRGLECPLIAVRPNLKMQLLGNAGKNGWRAISSGVQLFIAVRSVVETAQTALKKRQQIAFLLDRPSRSTEDTASRGEMGVVDWAIRTRRFS